MRVSEFGIDDWTKTVPTGEECGQRKQSVEVWQIAYASRQCSPCSGRVSKVKEIEPTVVGSFCQVRRP